MNRSYFVAICLLFSVSLNAMRSSSPRELRGEPFIFPDIQATAVQEFLRQNEIPLDYDKIIIEVLSGEYNPYDLTVDNRVKKLLIWAIFYYIRKGQPSKNIQKKLDEENVYGEYVEKILNDLYVRVHKMKIDRLSGVRAYRFSSKKSFRVVQDYLALFNS